MQNGGTLLQTVHSFAAAPLLVAAIMANLIDINCCVFICLQKVYNDAIGEAMTISFV